MERQERNLLNFYIASSYNSCCGGNVEKDFVDMVPLRQVIKQGARWLDFEIYSKNVPNIFNIINITSHMDIIRISISM